MKSLEERVEALEKGMIELGVKLGLEAKGGKEEKVDEPKENLLYVKGDFINAHGGSHFNLICGLETVFKEYEGYADIFASFGNVERVKIILALLEGPKTVKEIIANTGMRTTGQAYHHLNDLEKIGMVFKEDGKSYRIKGSYISCISLMFAGAHYLKKKTNKYVTDGEDD